MEGKDIFELSMEPEWKKDAQRAYTTILSMGDRVKKITEEDAIRLLEGAVDIHVHSIPDPEIDVGWDQLEISKKCMDMNMSAVVFKSHTIPTAATAYYVQQSIGEYARASGKKPIPPWF